MIKEKKELTRRDLLKILPILATAFLFKDAFLNKTTIYPLYYLPYEPINVDLPIDGLVSKIFPQSEAIITQPDGILTRLSTISDQSRFTKSINFE